jgi:membrane protein required for colicin V production
MNPLDIGIIALCALLALVGVFKGIVRQLTSWAGLLLGLVVGWKYGAEVQKLLRLDFAGGAIAAYLVALLTVYIAVRLIGLLLEHWVRGTKLSGTDRFLGMAAGLAKGAFLSVLLVVFLVLLLPRDTPLLATSEFSPRLLAAARWMEAAFPEKVRESLREKAGAASPRPAGEKGGRKGESASPDAQPKKRPRK